jgi:multidrug efflux system membrane fusion protein
LWPGQFVNIRLRVETLSQVVVIPTSAAQRGPAGTFSYVIGDDDTVTAKPIVVTQQNETDAVIATGLTTSDRVVTTGFANLSDGAKVIVGKDENAPTADLAPRKRRSSRDAQSKDGQVKKDWQGKEGKDGEHRGKRRERGQSDNEGDQKGPTGAAQGSDQSGGGAKSQP